MRERRDLISTFSVRWNSLIRSDFNNLILTKMKSNELPSQSHRLLSLPDSKLALSKRHMASSLPPLHENSIDDLQIVSKLG